MIAGDMDRTLKAMDFAKDGIVILNRAREVVFVDDGLLRMLGLDPEVDSRSNRDVLDRVQFAGAIPLTEVLDVVFKEGSWCGEAAGLTVDDHAVYLEITARKLSVEASDSLGVILVIRNVTRERMMENRVVEAQQMELVEKLCRGIGHEFKNLLTIITAYGSLLEMKLKDSDSQEEVNKILETASRANDLVRRMVAMTKRPEPNYQNTDLQEVMIELNALVTKALPSQVMVTTPEIRRLPLVYADGGSLIRSIIYIALNACEAMTEGGKLDVDVQVEVVSTDDVAADHPVRDAGKYVVISVTDDGHGMPPDVRARLFEPFFTTKVNGSGLGLCAVKKSIEEMNGTINVYSKPGKGTCVKLYLPVLGGQNVEADPSLEGLSGKETILVVDDDSMALSTVRKMLEIVGYTVLTANGGTDALRLIEEHGKELDLVLLDLVMPDLNGEAVYQEARAMCPSLKIIMSSGFPQATTGTMMELGDQPFISKPFILRELLTRVRSVLDSQG